MNEWTGEVPFTTSVTTWTSTSQSYSLSPTYLPGESYSYTTARGDEYDYAIPVGKAAFTTTVTSTTTVDTLGVTWWSNPPPTCTPKDKRGCTRGPNCDKCTVQGGTVRVLFWPPTTSPSGPSNATRTQLYSNDTTLPVSPVTAMFGTYTLTSPSVYVSFETAYAMNDCKQTVGSARTGALLAMDPKSLSTLQASLDYFDVTTSGYTTTFYQSAWFNPNDFTGLPPVSAYVNQPSCFAIPCYTIYPDYHPQLALPPQMRAMDPAWKSCALDWEGAWDPPIALHAQETMDAVTTSIAPAYTTPPSPQSVINGPARSTTAPSSIAVADPETLAAGDLSLGEVSADSQTNPTPIGSDPSIASAETSTADPKTIVSASFSQSTQATSSIVQVVTTLQVAPVPSKVTGEPSIVGYPSNTGTSSEMAADPAAQSRDSSATQQPSVEPWSNPTIGTTVSPSLAGLEGPATAQSSFPPPDSDTQPEAASSQGTETESPSPIVVAGQTVETAPNDGLAVAGKTISAGGQPLTVSSVIYSAVSGGGLAVASNSYVAASSPSPTNAYEVLSAAQATTPQVVTLTGADGEHYSVEQVSGGFETDGSNTVFQGQTASLSGLGYYISAGLNGQIFGENSAYPTATAVISASGTLTGAFFTQGSDSYIAYRTGSAGSSWVEIQGAGSSTIAALGQAVTLPGEQIASVQGDGNLIVGSATVQLSPLPASDASPVTVAATSSSEAVLTLGSTTLTARQQRSGVVAFGSQFVTPGGSAFVQDGHTISAATNGIVEDGSTIAFTTLASSATATVQAELSLGSVIVTAAADGPGTFALGDTTLSAGGSALVSGGHTLSAVSGGLVEDGRSGAFHTMTVSLPQVEASGSEAPSTLPQVTAGPSMGGEAPGADAGSSATSTSDAAVLWRRPSWSFLPLGLLACTFFA